MVHHRMLWALTGPALLFAMAVAPSSAQQIPDTANTPDEAAIAAFPKMPVDLPPNAPTVTCKKGQISIVADNATMGSVLSALRPCIGVVIDAPDGSSSTRMYAHLGPGSANEILQSLLWVYGLRLCDPALAR